MNIPIAQFFPPRTAHLVLINDKKKEKKKLKVKKKRKERWQRNLAELEKEETIQHLSIVFGTPTTSECK
ncbi:hypothetical protein CEXT_713301 [Caerostris extrusa]|uniref:Uncharacterized protein n=1 Tax=Caerostris extrusa TaxID=172846 RepID=A0AAV4QJC9_CAEEX|nr:hypothetical protein CEXT_713301 [Caerostris extrusa]